MIVVGLDIESTGLDKVKDRPIEVGMTLWTTNFNRGLENRSILVQSDNVKVTSEITEITGINQGMVDRFGLSPGEAYEEVEYFVERAEAIVAFNGRRFDIPMFRNWAKRVGKVWPEKFVIDPYEDMPATHAGPTPGMRPQELITMCAKNGIYYDAHAASADVEAMLRLMSKFPFETVLERAKSPVVVIQSQQDRSQNDRVKKHRFRWHPTLRIWWKAVKQVDLDALAKGVNNEFPMRERLDLTVEDLENE
jgi:DNA polymerase-3 subunit epsilon